MQCFMVVVILVVFSPLVALAQSETSSLQWHGWEDGIREANASGKFLLVDVYTIWCGWCKRMDQSVYVHPVLAIYERQALQTLLI